MCKLNRCPYEEDDHMQCEWCPYNEEWVKSVFDDFEDFEDFDDL